MKPNFLPNKSRVRYTKPNPLPGPGMKCAFSSIACGETGTIVSHGIMSTGHPYYVVRFDGHVKPHTAIDPRNIELVP
jgi:hypothetical protein